MECECPGCSYADNSFYYNIAESCLVSGASSVHSPSSVLHEEEVPAGLQVQSSSPSSVSDDDSEVVLPEGIPAGAAITGDTAKVAMALN